MKVMIKTRQDLDDIRNRGLQRLYPERTKLTVGLSTCGIAAGAAQVYNRLKTEIESREMDIILAAVGCIGLCQQEPIVDIWSPGLSRVFYKQMTDEKVPILLKELDSGFRHRQWILGRKGDDYDILTDKTWKYSLVRENGQFADIPHLEELPFYRKQLKIALRNCGIVDPDSLEEYVARGGYTVAFDLLTRGTDPWEMIDIVKRSGLRGRGGGGFPTGRKWETCRKAESDVRYVICNADEGDPGAYMDRSILEGDPHTVIEGMLIGAYAIGSNHGFIYVRNEYPRAVEKLRLAIQEARRYGILGDNIFGTGFSFDVELHCGAGAFVCGESTALMASLEGKVGEPRAKYVHTVQQGLWDKPSNLNNVETWANIPVIFSRGAEWFSKIGTENSKGTKVFSLVGKIRNTGLLEIPMGITLREILFGIGEGVPGKHSFKAVQTGGPSGGCLIVDTTLDEIRESMGRSPDGSTIGFSQSLIDLPVDFEQLTDAGSMMGSGGMIVMDDHDCMVDVARYFLDFLKDESCGKCVPCREGIRRMLEILNRICSGQGQMEDIELLEEMSSAIEDTALCALGTTAPNPVLSTLRYFREEYEEHIRDRHCRAGVCKELISFHISESHCDGCHACVPACPAGAIHGNPREPHWIDTDLCIKCGACYEACHHEAVSRI